MVWLYLTKYVRKSPNGSKKTIEVIITKPYVQTNILEFCSMTSVAILV